MATISATPTKQNRFEFSTDFNVKFDSAIDRYTKTLNALTSALHNQGKLGSVDEYGMYQSCYTMRYITPTQVSEYVDLLNKAITKNMLNPNFADLEKFTVAFVKEAFKESNCKPIDETDLCGNYIDADAQGLSLQSLYLIMNNEVHQPIVCSAYETKERRKMMLEGDFKNISSLNFVSCIKAMCSKMSTIVNDAMGFCECQYMQRKMFSEYLEKFILFTIETNVTCLKSMLDYVTPSTSYNVSEMTENVVTESVDTDKNEMMFIVMTEGQGFIVSNTIRKITNCRYSHASISFSSDMHHIHTFDGAVNGYSLEDMNQKKYEKTPFTVYGTWVSKDAMERMRKKVADVRNGNNKYDWTYCTKTLFGINSKIPSETDYKYVCSSFVNAVMKAGGVGVLREKDIKSNTGVATPAEIYDAIKDNPEFICVFDGLGMNYNEAEAVARMKIAAKEKTFKPFEGVYTECSMGDMIRVNRIPFNCNMRDIVLQDTHPYFKDTWSAIDFILTDTRSPIGKLVEKYMSDDVPFESICDPELVAKMFMNVKPYHPCDPEECSGDYYKRYHKVDFHTDVNWLDKIAYGNNSLNGNWRVDALGNNKFNPIVMTLDSLWKMFNTEDAKSNNELADAIIRVAMTIKSIIITYRKGMICDWYTTKDILALLGEIFTRSMLRLYDNNNKVYNGKDVMNDTMDPGYMYTEACLFFNEADEDNAKTTKTDETAKTGVEIQNDKGEAVNATVGTKLKNLLAKFVAWVQDILSKFPGKFNENHKMEIKWINDHSSLNDAIGKALDDGSFKVKLTNFTLYNIDPTKAKYQDLDTFLTSFGKNDAETKDAKAMLIPGPKEFVEKVKGMEKEKKAEAIKNLIFYGIENPDESYKPIASLELKSEQWKQIINTLTKMPENIETISKQESDSYKKASDKIKDVLDHAESDEKKNECTNLYNGLKESSNIMTQTLNNLQKVVYRGQYSLYRQIVNGYNQQKGKGESAPESKAETNTQTGQGTGNQAKQ